MALEKAYRNFSEWFSLFFSTCISLVKAVLRSGYRSHLPKTAVDTCILLGNGQSFKQSLEKYLAQIQKQPLICTNYFAITGQYHQLCPQYYVMLDPAYWFGRTGTMGE